MSFKKFSKNDKTLSTVRTYPHNSFFIYSGSVVYNNHSVESGSFSNDVKGTSGGISLYEFNIDKAGTTVFTGSVGNEDIGTITTGKNPPIIPFVIKGSSNQLLKSTNRKLTLVGFPTASDGSAVIQASGPSVDVSREYASKERGDILTGSAYTLSSSIFRELLVQPGVLSSAGVPNSREFFALKNTLDFYGTRSTHYRVTSSFGNKNTQTINLIKIPKIFYGTKIKPGSLSLKFFYTGSLVGELSDSKYNGELIQTGPTGSTGSGSVAGVVLYEEGFILLTGSWGLTQKISLKSGSSDVSGSWLYFGAGANDGIAAISGIVSSSYHSASFDLSFKGMSDVHVSTLYTHARRGEVNFSNNPTFIEYGQTYTSLTSSNIYQENDKLTIKNTVSSSFSDHTADFKRQVYISRIGVYDKDKNLLGIATLSNPILKEEGQDISFKLKMDF